MTDRLTDEQLEAIAKDRDCAWPESIEAMATELLALRAERAKPTQIWPVRGSIPTGQTGGLGLPSRPSTSAILLIARLRAFEPCDADLAELEVDAAFASIRAEGSAERAKLEAALRKIAHGREVRHGDHTEMEDIADPSGVAQACLDKIAQAAESGATERRTFDPAVVSVTLKDDPDTCPTCGGIGGTSDCLCQHPTSGAKP